MWEGINRRFGSASAFVAKTALDLTDSVNGALSDLSGDDEEVAIYKKMLADFQFEQINLSREYQKIVAEKEADLSDLRAKLEAINSSSSTTTTTTNTTDDDDNDSQEQRDRDKKQDMMDAERLKVENEILGDTVKAWEKKLRDLLLEKTDFAATIQKQRSIIEALESKSSKRGKLPPNPPLASASSPKSRTSSMPSPPKTPLTPNAASNPRDQETIDNLVSEYSRLSCESEIQREENIELKTRLEEYMVKMKAHEKNILILTEQNKNGGGRKDSNNDENLTPKMGRNRGGSSNGSNANSDMVEELKDKVNTLTQSLITSEENVKTQTDELKELNKLALGQKSSFEKDMANRKKSFEEDVAKIKADMQTLHDEEMTKLREELGSSATNASEDNLRLKNVIKEKDALLISTMKEKDENLRAIMKEKDEHYKKALELKEEQTKKLIKEAESEHASVVGAMKSEHAKIVEGLEGGLSSSAEALKEEQAAAIDSIKREHAAAIDLIKGDHASVIESREGEIESLKKENAAAVESHAAAIDSLKNELRAATESHASALESLKVDHSNTLQSLKSEHETVAESHATAIESLKSEHTTAIEKMVDEHTSATNVQEANHAAAIETLNTTHSTNTKKLIDEHREAVEALKSEHNSNVETLQQNHLEQLQLLGEKLKETQANLESVEVRWKKIIEDELSAQQKVNDERLASELENQRLSFVQTIQDANDERDECKALYLKENQRRKLIHNKLIEIQGNIRVVARVRPAVEVEVRLRTRLFLLSLFPTYQLSHQSFFYPYPVSFLLFHPSPLTRSIPPPPLSLFNPLCTQLSQPDHREVIECPTGEDLTVHRDKTTRTKFEFDKVCDQDSTQIEAYEVAQALTISVLDGYNVCIFAYGQTGSGKTFTMEGPEDNRGVNFRALKDLFDIIEERREDASYNCYLSILEIYNETIRDIMNPSYDEYKNPKKLDIRQSADGNVVQGLSEVEVSCCIIFSSLASIYPIFN